MAICGIYRIRNKVNNKFYIGSSVDIKRRFASHFLNLSKNRHDNQHLQNAWNKYGKNVFETEVVKVCNIKDLLTEEQMELNIWVGHYICYNIRQDAKCPVAPGSKRPEWIIKKYADAQRGKPRWTSEQKKQMSIDRMGRTHSNETKKNMIGRKSSFENISKAQDFNVGRIYSTEHCLNIKNGKIGQWHDDNDRSKISIGVNKAILEGRYHKNKVPKEKYDDIKNEYLSGTINKRQLAFKYGITPTSMQKLLKRIGI